MILCDQVIRDMSSKKVTIVGTFTNILAPSFPAVHPRLAVYLALTEGMGTYNGEMQFKSAETDEVLMKAGGPFVLDDPLQILELHIEVPGLRLPEPGKYRMEFFCDGQFLRGRWFVASVLEEGAGS